MRGESSPAVRTKSGIPRSDVFAIQTHVYVYVFNIQTHIVAFPALTYLLYKHTYAYLLFEQMHMYLPYTHMHTYLFYNTIIQNFPISHVKEYMCTNKKTHILSKSIWQYARHYIWSTKCVSENTASQRHIFTTNACCAFLTCVSS